MTYQEDLQEFKTDGTGALLINNRKLARAEKNVLPFLEPRG